MEKKKRDEKVKRKKRKKERKEERDLGDRLREIESLE